MQRKYFETIQQKCECDVIIRTVQNMNEERTKKYKKYNYHLIKLPATFMNQKVQIWHPDMKRGKWYIASKSGDSAEIRIDENDFPGLRKGDRIIASFNNQKK